MIEPHDVLEVPAGASEREVRAAFRRYASVHHPDRGGDPSRFIAGQRAYEALLQNRRGSRRGPSVSPAGAPVQFHRRNGLGTTLRSAVRTTAHRITRRPMPPPRVQ